jgi:hypothetical protein
MGNGLSNKRSAGPGSVRATLVGRVLVRAIAVFLLACWATVGAVGVDASANAAKREVVKVFVVADPSQTGGQLPTLQSIAASTLRDSGRAGEIFNLNKGRTQPDGGALTSPNDQLHPGWILRLPADASGPDVKLAQDNSGGSSAVQGGSTANQAGAQSGTVVSFPLAAGLAVVGSILLALVTAAIVARRRVARWFAFVGRAFAALGAPARRRRRLALRRSLSQRFAADLDSVRGAYRTFGEVATTAQQSEKPVYALRVDNAGATVWLSASDTLSAPWQQLDSTRWRRPAAAATWGIQSPANRAPAARDETADACLVRVGADTDSEPVFVDLSRLDGVLSVTGNRAVARDVVQNLLSELARIRPNTPVTVLPAADGGVPLSIPAGLTEITRVPAPAPNGANGMHGTVRGAAARRPVGGLVVMAGAPTAREAAELLALCGTRGAGWTGLVCGPVEDGAHWRWHTDANGSVRIPVLGMELTVPA